MSSDHFFALYLRTCPSEIIDEVVALCFEHGATGTSEELNYNQKSLALDPVILERSVQDMAVFFMEEPSFDLLEEIKGMVPTAHVELKKEPVQDWLQVWKKGFESFRLVGETFVVPSWRDAPPEAKTIIRIDPGLAFGTGTHATTQMAAYFIHRTPLRSSLLDVGAGTGILSILAAKEGFQRVLGIEIDPEAKRVFRENVSNNEESVPQMFEGLIEELSEDFNVIVVNIIESVILEMKSHILKRLRPGGHLFLTGILSENEDQFREKFEHNLNEFTLERRLQANDWLGLWYIRGNS